MAAASTTTKVFNPVTYRPLEYVDANFKVADKEHYFHFLAKKTKPKFWAKNSAAVTSKVKTKNR